MPKAIRWVLGDRCIGRIDGAVIFQIVHREEDKKRILRITPAPYDRATETVDYTVFDPDDHVMLAGRFQCGRRRGLCEQATRVVLASIGATCGIFSGALGMSTRDHPTGLAGMGLAGFSLAEIWSCVNYEVPWSHSPHTIKQSPHPHQSRRLKEAQ